MVTTRLVGRVLIGYELPPVRTATRDAAAGELTDPDSRIMKRAGGGFDASYNAQTAVDE